MTLKTQNLKRVLTENVEEVLPSKDALLSAASKKKLRVYIGIDPTSPKLHLGHAAVLWKLKELQDLGHKVIFLFGTFTARIGDPTDRGNARKPLTEKEIRKNVATYKSQASKILNMEKVEVRENAAWFTKMPLGDVLTLASHFTVARLLERDMFQKRMQEGKEVWTHELLYPLLQGYDSVMLNVDMEIGGNDQLFNMMVGRKLQSVYHKKEKFVLTVPLLLGLDGRKMSKTYENAVYLTDSPKEMFGKLMSLRDEYLPSYFTQCTRMGAEELKEVEKALRKKGSNLRTMKAKLAKEIVSLYHGTKEAERAEEEFNAVFQKKETPKSISSVRLQTYTMPLTEFLLEVKLVSSKAEAKRVIAQGGVKVGGEEKKDPKESITFPKGIVVQVGKRKFLKIT
jgi:tyrosyl-tRNA synthetase